MTQATGKSQAQQRPIAILRDRLGGMADSMKQYVKNQNRVRKAILETLKATQATVPEIAAAHGLKTSDVMWQLMAMKRYGRIVEVEPKGDYYTYRLKEVT